MPNNIDTEKTNCMFENGTSNTSMHPQKPLRPRGVERITTRRVLFQPETPHAIGVCYIGGLNAIETL